MLTLFMLTVAEGGEIEGNTIVITSMDGNTNVEDGK